MRQLGRRRRGTLAGPSTELAPAWPSLMGAVVVAAAAWSPRGRAGKSACTTCRADARNPAGTFVDHRKEMGFLEKQIVSEVNRFEDPLDPIRPPVPPRDRKGLWAPPGPDAVSAPEVLVVGLGRQLRPNEADGPRARLGAGAVEALQHRYQIKTFFDADIQGYTSTTRASLDKSGRAGVQKIHMVQPVLEQGRTVAHAMQKLLERPQMDKAMVLFVLSDHSLPFGQLRLRTAFDSSDSRLRSAYRVLGPGNRVTCLSIGAGWGDPKKELLAAEQVVLPKVLGNAATAIEVWLSEADVGLVMRFVNRPEVYEMPPGWPYTDKVLEGPAGTDAVAADDARELEGRGVPALEEHSEISTGSLMGAVPGDQFALFDLNRDNPADLPNVVLAPMSPEHALAALAERPPAVQSLTLAGRRYNSLAKLTAALGDILLETVPGRHLRFEDDEEAMKTLLSFHPAGDRLLEDLVAVKVDCSPIDDNVRCLWIIKYDGEEEDVSVKECLAGLEEWMTLESPQEQQESRALLRTSGKSIPRLGPGRWVDDIRRDTIFERARIEEIRGKESTEIED